MKKIFTSICLIALVGFFVCSTAVADETLCGTAIVKAIRLLPSNAQTDVPLGACLVAVEFTTQNNQTAVITAVAYGTQINLALLKALNFRERIGMCIIWKFATSQFRIIEVTFIAPDSDEAAAFPKMTAEDLEKLK